MTQPNGDLDRGQFGSRPVPDPTLLTTAALTREVSTLRELLEAKAAAIQEVIDTRLDAMDRAVNLLQQHRDNYPTELNTRLQLAMELIDQRFLTQDQRFATVFERFDSIRTQFSERDTRGERESRDNKVAVDAAFAAQKEAAAKQDEANQKAIDKSEKATGETLNKQADLFKSTTDALAAQIGDLKDRLTRTEGLAHGTVTAATEASLRTEALSQDLRQQQAYTNENHGRRESGTQHIGWLVGGFGGIIGLVALIIELVRSAPKG